MEVLGSGWVHLKGCIVNTELTRFVDVLVSNMKEIGHDSRFLKNLNRGVNNGTLE